VPGWDNGNNLRPRHFRSKKRSQSTRSNHHHHHHLHLWSFSDAEQELVFWTASFASTHIGLSAIRQNIIKAFGETAESLSLVGNADWKLPPFWLNSFADDASEEGIFFPNSDTAGRQLYRIFYTFVSFLTLGNAFATYRSMSDDTTTASTAGVLAPPTLWTWYEGGVSSPAFITAVLASAAAVASLFNASPLGLMPGFEIVDDESSAAVTLRRKDSLKFQVTGLTRISRHPLILPVVPWGFSTAVLLGGKASDWIFFGGLAVYAVAGCAAQDMRVSKQEGSVGTVFDQDMTELQTFFESTSLVPFSAVAQGKQSLKDIVKEVPWLQLILIGIPVGYIFETTILRFLL
jgi:uncharacterized membrane protein